MQMHPRSHPFLRTIALLSSCFLWTACSVGIDPTEDPVQPSSAETDNFSNEENEENEENEAENNSDSNNVTNNSSNSGNQNAEESNNSSEENFLNNNGQGNLFSNNQGNNNLLNNGGNNNLGLENNAQNADELVNGAEGNGIVDNSEDNQPPNENVNIEEAATDNTLANAENENTILDPVGANEEAPRPEQLEPSPPGNTSATGVVKYVVAGGSKLHTQPNGSVVKELEQGDHPLVNADGEWARTSDGYYIPSQTLTSEPIGRLKQPKVWR